jgi:hypothetical protein
MKCLLAAFLLLSVSAKAQPSDFIILKKKNHTIKTFYAGTNIQFTATNGAYRDALITGIRNDTIYLQEFYILRLPTSYGGFIIDTAGSFRYAYHYNQVKSFGAKAYKGFNVNGSGAALLGGGVLLTLASGVSYLANKDKFSPELLVAAASLGTIGYFMSKAGSKGMVIGKKYRLQYMDVTAR